MDLLHEAPNLLARYKHGDAFRQYVQSRMPLVVAALVFFLIVSMATTAAVVVYFGGTSSLAVLACLVVAPFLLVGGLLVQSFVFFSWLERRAIDRVAGRKPCSLREHLPEVPWTFAAIFLAVPFFILALVSIKVAVTLLVIGVLAPVAHSFLERE